MEKSLKTMNSVVYVANKKIQSIYSFEIEQAFCEHHTFTLVLDHDVFQKSFMDKPLDVFDLVGLPVLIGMGMGPEDEWDKVIDFYGIIRKARIKAEMGGHGKVILEGNSSTVLFEQEPRMDVFAGVPLSSILNRFYNGINKRHLDISIDTAFKSFIEFVMQYKETDWQFLQRISRQFGENLYYDGTKLIFGKLDDTHEIETLEYDSEISEFDFSTRLLPANFDICHYLPDSDTRMFEGAPSNISDSSPYTDKAFRRGREMAELLPPTLTLDMPVKGQADMNEIIKSKQNRRAAEMVYFNGVSKSIKVALGRVVRIVQSEKVSQNTNLGDYRIVSCKRMYSANEEYRCVFSAIPDKLPVVPVPHLPEPVAGPVIARVFSNEDPLGLGRVEVHFPFATNRYTYWLRVQTPYAGSSAKLEKGRGFTFIPEKGDQVIVSFEENNPNKPYVSGSLFHGKNATGGGEDNYIKSIVTDSGHTIAFDDDENGAWGITIKDKNGNCIHLDTKGNNIEITAPEKISFVSKEVSIDTNKISINAKADILLSTQSLVLEGKDKLNAVGSNINISAYSNLRTYGGVNKIMGKQKVELAGPKIENILSGYSETANFSKQNLSAESSNSPSSASSGSLSSVSNVTNKSQTPENVAKQDASKMEQLKKDFYQDYANWVQDLINVLQDWNNYMGTVDKSQGMTLQTIANQIIYLFKIDPEIRFISDQVFFLGNKLAKWIMSEGQISFSDFYSVMLNLLTKFKNGLINKAEILPDILTEYERDNLFDEFLKYCQENGASKPKQFIQFLDPFFNSIRALYSAKDFFRALTIMWISASKDSWDFDDYAGVLEIKLVLSNIPLIDSIKGTTKSPPKWSISEFYIDDLTKEDGVLAALKSVYFDNGNFNALNLPIDVRLHLTVDPRFRSRYDLYPQQEVVYIRNYKGVWTYKWGTKQMFEDFRLLKHDELLFTKNLQKD